MRCAVKNCNNNNKSKPCKISFFNFPSDTELLKQWEGFCCRDNKMNVKTSQICMEHFKPEDFENSLQFKMGFTKRLLLKRGAVPTVRKAQNTDDKRHKASERRKQKHGKNKNIVERIIKEHDGESDLLKFNAARIQPMETDIFVEGQIHVKSEVLPEHEIIKEDAKFVLSNEVGKPVQPIKTEVFVEDQIHVKSEVLSEDEIIEKHDAESISCNAVVSEPVQPMEANVFMTDQIHLKSEVFTEDEIIKEYDTKFVSCNAQVKVPPMQPMEIDISVEDQIHIKSEVLSEHEIIKEDDAKSVSSNEVGKPPVQPIKTEVFVEDQIHVKSEVFSEDEMTKEHDSESVSCNVLVSEPPVRPMEAKTFMTDQIHVKSEVPTDYEIINEYDTEFVSCIVEVNVAPMQPMESGTFMERHFHSESDQKKKFVKNNDEKNKIKCLKMEIKRLCKENFALKHTSKKQAAKLRILKEKEEKDSKMCEYDLDCLKTQLMMANYELSNLEERLLSIFSKGQIAKLKAGVKSTKWSEEDVTHAITLYAVSSKFYKMLRREHFPLPAVRSLRSWAQEVCITPGLLEPVFKLLSATIHMSEIDKICVLSFGEAEIRKNYCYDTTSDSTLAPVKYVQVAMIRGLIAKWKQPIFYEYDCKMTVNILNNILFKLKSCGYSVVAIVSDLKQGDRALFNKLQVTEKKPWFTFDGEKVFVFADVPHMIKDLRNYFVDEGFLINGKPVRAEIISKLFDINSGDLTITHKISQTSLNVGNGEKQNVKLATKLFSNTVAQAIMKAAGQGHLKGLNWNECHKLFKLTNDWFDVMNVKLPYTDVQEHCRAYGLSLETQNRILDEMTEMVRKMRVIGRKTLLPFQKGIIQSNNAIKGLYENMLLRYRLKFILTYRLNQDVLGSFFEVIRTKGGQHDHFNQLEFKHRLRSYILGQNVDVIIHSGNVESSDTLDLEKMEKCLTGRIIRVLNIDVNRTEESAEQELTDIQCDSLESLARYICYRLKDDIPDIVVPENNKSPTCSRADHLTKGGLWKPSEKTMQLIQELNRIFKSNNGQGLHITKDFIKSLIEQAGHIKCDTKLKALFFRTKMYFRIRKLNQEIFDNTCSK